MPLEIVVGEKDSKFKKIANEMQTRIGHGEASVIEIPSAGHAVHVENPLDVITALRNFIKTEKKTT